MSFSLSLLSSAILVSFVTAASQQQVLAVHDLTTEILSRYKMNIDYKYMELSQWLEYLKDGTDEPIDVDWADGQESDMFVCPRHALKRPNGEDFKSENSDKPAEEVQMSAVELVEACLAYEFDAKFEPVVYVNKDSKSGKMWDFLSGKLEGVDVIETPEAGDKRQRDAAGLFNQALENCIKPAIRHSCLRRPTDAQFEAFKATSQMPHEADAFKGWFQMNKPSIDEGEKVELCRGLKATATARNFPAEFGGTAEMVWDMQLTDELKTNDEERGELYVWCRPFKCPVDGERAVCGYGYPSQCACKREYQVDDYIREQNDAEFNHQWPGHQSGSSGRRLLVGETA